MNRKAFLKNTVKASLSTLVIGNVLSRCGPGMQQSTASKTGQDGRVLVLIQMNGGNDGLNTVIPIDQYAALLKARKNILIPEKKILALNNSSITGLHPSLEGLQKLYNNKELAIVQGVGNTYPSLSHFKAMEIWNTCYDNIAYSDIQTGWLGRFLDEHKTKSNAEDPLAIQTSAGLSQALQGYVANTGVAVEVGSYLYDLETGHYAAAPDTAAGRKLSSLRTMISESRGFLTKIKAVTDARKTMSTMYPPMGKNSLADQLKLIAQLIGGGLRTRIYIANINGFDTHISQADASDPTKGSHADLLANTSSAIAAFQDDLALMGVQDKVMGMVFSEFGRRIMSNASYGSDHGTAAPVMFFGAKVKGGLVGNNPVIPAKVGVYDNLPLQNDFRSIYATVLKGWFGVSEIDMNKTLLGTFPTLDLFRS